MARTGSWFSLVENADAGVQFFVFPHAGGSALGYRGWLDSVGSGWESRVLQLPGRQERLEEPAFTSLEPLMALLVERFEAELDGRPYVLFGHSFGALLAYRLTRELEQCGVQGPEVLGVSGWAPKLVASDELAGVADMTDEEILARVGEFGLVPDGVVGREMLSTVMPSLRGDFMTAGDYVDDGAVVSSPVAAYGGVADRVVGPGGLEVWAERTEDFLGVSEFPGDHFYLFEHAVAVQSSLERHVRRRLTGRG